MGVTVQHADTLIPLSLKHVTGSGNVMYVAAECRAVIKPIGIGASPTFIIFGERGCDGGDKS